MKYGLNNKLMFCELMGICFSCRRPANNRLNNKISEHISSSVTPLHVCLDEQRENSTFGNNFESFEQNSQQKIQSINYKKKEEDQEKTEEETEVILLEEQTELNELKQIKPRMANAISNMKLKMNPIRQLVSKRRKRFTADGFDLDLTYIKENLIAMGFPAEKLEGVYRNHIDDVVRFLESKHKDHYKIYNLCSERSYDCKKFKERVENYAFDDHNPPPLEIIKPFCEDVHKWLSQDESNVAAVHCKAGKGRTGVMLCCYLLHSEQCKTANEALNFYGTERTTDRKGVTIPSQRRYVNYYATLVQEGLSYKPVTLILREIRLSPIPIFNGGQGYRYVISEANKKIFSSENCEVRKGSSSLCIPLEHSISITGDIKVSFYNIPKVKRKEKMFSFWFNTFFVNEYSSDYDNGELPVERTTRALSCDGSTMELPAMHIKPRTGSLANLNPLSPTLSLTVDKSGLDGPHKDKNHKLFSENFKVSLFMGRANVTKIIPTTVSQASNSIPMDTGCHQTQSESSETDSSECDTTGDEDGWESGESTYL